MQTSPDIFGIASAFIMHSGSRHVSFDLTDIQKKLIAHPFSKFLILFAMFYVSTRSLYWSFLLLLFYFILVKMLLNEHHPLNVIPKTLLVQEGFLEKETKSHTELYLDNIKSI
jgi:hypothetical protein